MQKSTVKTENNDKSKLYYEGIPVFFDIEDKQLRKRNQAVVLTNLIESTLTDGMVPKKTLSLVVGYFQQIPAQERDALQQEMQKQIKERGLKRDE